MLRVRVGSLNAAKLEAVRRGLSPFSAQLEIEGCEARTGVPEQPIGFDEILAGARTRARESFALGNVDLGAGIEDGLIELPAAVTGYLNVGFCVLFDGTEESLGLTAGFEYPSPCVRAATGPQRVPVGGAFDALFEPPPGWPDPGPGAGNIGRLTGGVLTRAEYGAQAVTCAYVRRLHPALYGGGAP
ncbi:MAG: DUF84 family protein [Myxococcota bacterium]